MQTKERNTNLEELFFPVTSQDIFTKIGESEKLIRIPGKQVLINASNNTPISVVSDDYEIVTNKDAYEYGSDCLNKLFKLKNNDSIEIFNIFRPSTLSFCHMDLVCPTKKFEYKKEQFVPFVRITNSYNKLFKLYFRIGICRSICENGMIFGEDSIKFSFNHMRGKKDKVSFDINPDDFEKILNKFKSEIEVLMENKFNFEYSRPMIYKGLGLNLAIHEKTKKQREFVINLENKISVLLKIYQKSLGDSFYTIYNIITDIGTRGIDDESLLVTKIHSRQARAGKWLSSVSQILRNNKFIYADYLRDYPDLHMN